MKLCIKKNSWGDSSNRESGGVKFRALGVQVSLSPPQRLGCHGNNWMCVGCFYYSIPSRHEFCL